VLSPDGSRIAFAWDRNTGDNFDIFVKLVDSGDPQPVTSDPAAERAPAWSPDGGAKVAGLGGYLNDARVTRSSNRGNTPFCLLPFAFCLLPFTFLVRAASLA
jgi:Tol biopolymer transport system component